MLRTSDKRLFVEDPLGSVFGPANPLPVTANLQGWYDCSDVGSLTIVSNKVSQWNDKSGNGFNLTQATAGTRPLYDATPRTINGVIVPEFANAQYMSSSCPADDRTSTTFFAGVLDTIGSNCQLFGSSATGGDGMRVIISTGQLRTMKDNVAFLTDGERISIGQLLVCQRLTATTIEQCMLGTTQILGESTTFTAATTLRLGGESTATVLWDGLIAEFIRYSVTLTDSQMDAVNLYLFRKWFVR